MAAAGPAPAGPSSRVLVGRFGQVVLTTSRVNSSHEGGGKVDNKQSHRLQAGVLIKIPHITKVVVDGINDTDT